MMENGGRQFSEAQIAYILRYEEGTAIGEGPPDGRDFRSDFYNWRKKWRVAIRDEATTRDENKLKKLVADLPRQATCCRTSSRKL